MLTASGLYKSFGDKHILKNVDIAIAPGSITCIIGPSGTGKTTLLRSLAMLDFPDRGTINVDEETFRFPTTAEEINPPCPKLTALFQSLFL